MSEIKTFFIRGKCIESVHSIKCLVINSSGKIIFSTGHDEDIIFPRSSIKIFQAIPFASSQAIVKYKLTDKQIALSCSSHVGEKYHLTELLKWFKKLNIPIKTLKCGVHNPIDHQSSNSLLLSGIKPNQLHNNCAGKHLSMLSASLANDYNLKNYLNYNHPIQKNIRNYLELFAETKIRKNNFAIDGCSAPQYGLKIKEIAKALLNLNKSYDGYFVKSNEIKKLINSILNNPKYIGGTKNLDSNFINISNGKLFCKGGAEGVLLFTHLKKKISGVLKVSDGNERALPSALFSLIEKFKILPKEKINELKNSQITKINNHAGKIIGSMSSIIK